MTTEEILKLVTREKFCCFLRKFLKSYIDCVICCVARNIVSHCVLSVFAICMMILAILCVTLKFWSSSDPRVVRKSTCSVSQWRMQWLFKWQEISSRLCFFSFPYTKCPKLSACSTVLYKVLELFTISLLPLPGARLPCSVLKIF